MKFFMQKCLAIGIALTFIAALTQEIQSATVVDLRNKIQERNDQIRELEEEIAAYQKTLLETSGQSKTLEGEIGRLQTQIKKLNADIRLTQNRINTTELRIDALALDIAEKEEKIRGNREALGAVLQAIYEDGNESLVEIFLKTEKMSDFFSSVEYAQNLEISVEANLASLKELKAIYEEEKGEQEEKQQDLTRLHDELGDRKAIEESNRTKTDTLLKETKNEEVRYQKLLTRREAERENVLAEIQEIEDELRKLIDPASLPEARSGVLGWPVEGSAVLTQSFGNTPDAKILYNGQPHNGIDLRASVGTPILAAEDGVVRNTGNTDAFPRCLSYGKWILIDHPNNLSTLYAHLSLIKVNVGQAVKRGELIGYSGSTGYATGPHLHFTVYDSRTVTFQRSKTITSTCELLPYGGYLNPLAYL